MAEYDRTTRALRIIRRLILADIVGIICIFVGWA